MKYGTPYVSITTRNERRYNSNDDWEQYTTLSMELLASEEKLNQKDQFNCMTPPDKIVQDHYGFNETINDMITVVKSDELTELCLVNEIKRMVNQLGNSKTSYPTIDESDDEEKNNSILVSIPPTPVQNLKKPLSPRSTLLLPSIVFKESKSNEMGNSTPTDFSKNAPNKKSKQISPTSFLWVKNKNALPSNRQFLSKLQNISSSLSSQDKFAVYPPKLKRSYSENSAYSFRVNEPLFAPLNVNSDTRVNNEIRINHQDSKVIISPSKLLFPPKTKSESRPRVVSCDEPAYNVEVLSVTESLFQDQSFNHKEVYTEQYLSKQKNINGTEQPEAKLDYLADLNSRDAGAVSRHQRNYSFTTAEFEGLHQLLRLSNPAPRPKHLVNQEEHLGLSPTSAERAISLEKGHALHLQKNLDMNKIPLLSSATTVTGPLVIPIEDTSLRVRPIHRKTMSTTDSLRSANSSSIIHPHDVAATEFGTHRSSSSLSSTRSNSAQSTSSRISATHGVIHRGSSPTALRKLSATSEPTRIATLTGTSSTQNLVNNYGSNLDMPHYQLPTAQSRMRDVRNNGNAFDSPTPAGRASTMPYVRDYANSSPLQRRGSSASMVRQERVNRGVELSGRTSSASNSSGRNMFDLSNSLNSNKKATDHRRSKSMVLVKGRYENVDVDGIPFSLDANIAGERFKKNYDYMDYAEGPEGFSKESDVDLKSLQIELEGVKKLVSMLQERLTQHIPEPEQHDDNNTGSTNAKQTKSKMDELNPENGDNDGGVEKEAKVLLEILESESEPSNGKIQRHLSNLSRGLQEGKIASNTIGTVTQGDDLEAKPGLERNAIPPNSNMYATEEKVCSSTDETRSQNYSQKREQKQKVHHTQKSNTPSVRTVISLLLTLAGGYCFACLYLFLIDYTENTSTPF